MMRDVPYRIAALHRGPLLARGLSSLEDCLGFGGDATVKAARPGRTTVRFESAGRTYFLKRVAGRGAREIVNEARVLHHLGLDAFPAPEPAALGAGEGHAALITVGLPAARCLEDILCREVPPPARVRDLVERAARLLRRLHDLGVNHRDFYVGHLLVDDDDQVFAVDFGRAQLRRRVPRSRMVKDLAAFAFSAPERVVDAVLREHFLRSWSGDADPVSFARLAAAVDRKSRRMRRHAERMLARGRPNVHINH